MKAALNMPGILGLMLASLAFGGCSTVAPAHVTPAGHSVAFDGPCQDAGIPDALNPVKAADGRQIGLRVTAFYMDSLQARVVKYGARLTPPLTLSNYLATAHQMPDVPGRGPTWFVPDGLVEANARMAGYERNLAP